MRVAFVALRNDRNDARLVNQSKALAKRAETVEFHFLEHSPLDADDVRHSKIGSISRRLEASMMRFRSDSLLAPALGPLFGKTWAAMVRTRLARAIRAFRPTHIVAHEPECLAMTAPLADAFGSRLIFDAHEFYEDQRGADDARRAWLRRTLDACLPHVTSMITVSPGLRTLYLDQYPLLKDITIIPNATSSARPSPYDGRLHNALGLPTTTSIALYQGALWHGRGLVELAKGAHSLSDDWALVFMGDGPCSSELDGFAKVHVHPAVPHAELLEWTTGASIGIIPFRDDNLNHRHCLPNKLFEYAAAGVPVLSRALPDLAAIVQEHGIGEVCSINASGHEMLQRVEGLTPGQLSTMRTQCGRFDAQHSWHAVEPRYLSVFDHPRSR